MGQVIDFWNLKEIRPPMAQETKCRCGNCGSDLWNIDFNGEARCADCEENCPLRLQTSKDGN